MVIGHGVESDCLTLRFVDDFIILLLFGFDDGACNQLPSRHIYWCEPEPNNRQINPRCGYSNTKPAPACVGLDLGQTVCPVGFKFIQPSLSFSWFAFLYREWKKLQGVVNIGFETALATTKLTNASATSLEIVGFCRSLVQPQLNCRCFF